MKTEKTVRLSNKEIKAIKETAKDIFGKKTLIYVFGSRTNINRKGGDIDLLIIPENKENFFEKKLNFLAKLKTKIGEQKIDVIISGYDSKTIEDIARKTGVLL